MSILVQIEYCKNCSLHSWCSHHDEVKYIDYFEQMSRRIQQQIPNAKVIERKPTDNLVPRKNPANDGAMCLNTQTGQFVNFPRLGGFEIYVDGARIFSKVKSKVWPKFDNIMEKIKKIRKAKQDGLNIMTFDIDHIAKQEQKSRFTVHNSDKYDIRAIFRVRKSSGKNDHDFMNSGQRSRHRQVQRSLDISRQLNNPQVYETFVQECEIDQPKTLKAKQKYTINSARKARNVYLQEVYPRNRRKLVISKIDSNRIMLQNQKGERIAYRKQIDLDQIDHIDRKILQSGSSNVRVQSRRNNRRKLMPIKQGQGLKTKINSIPENQHKIQANKQQDLYDEMRLSQKQRQYIELLAKQQENVQKQKAKHAQNEKQKQKQKQIQSGQKNITSQKVMQSSQNPKVSKIQQSNEQQEYDNGYQDQKFEQSFKAKNSALSQNKKAEHQINNKSIDFQRHKDHLQKYLNVQEDEYDEESIQESKQFHAKDEQQQIKVQNQSKQKLNSKQNQHNPSVEQIDEHVNDEIASQKQFQMEQIQELSPQDKQKHSNQAVHQVDNKHIIADKKESANNHSISKAQPNKEQTNKTKQMYLEVNTNNVVKQEKKQQVKYIEKKHQIKKIDQQKSKDHQKKTITNNDNHKIQDNINDNKQVEINKDEHVKVTENVKNEHINKAFEQLTKNQQNKPAQKNKDKKQWKGLYMNGQFHLIESSEQQTVNSNKQDNKKIQNVTSENQNINHDVAKSVPKMYQNHASNIKQTQISIIRSKQDQVQKYKNIQQPKVQTKEKQEIHDMNIKQAQVSTIKNKQEQVPKHKQIEQPKIQTRQIKVDIKIQAPKQTQIKQKPVRDQINWQATVVNGQFYLNSLEKTVPATINDQHKIKQNLSNKTDKKVQQTKPKQQKKQIKVQQSKMETQKWVAYCKNGQFKLDKQQKQQSNIVQTKQI